jgi:hypothetical protein
MKLAAIEPSDTGNDLRTFACPACKGVQRHIIESTVTEAYLQPLHGVEACHGSTVTYEIRDGRMIPKSAE